MVHSPYLALESKGIAITFDSLFEFFMLGLVGLQTSLHYVELLLQNLGVIYVVYLRGYLTFDFFQVQN